MGMEDRFPIRHKGEIVTPPLMDNYANEMRRERLRMSKVLAIETKIGLLTLDGPDETASYLGRTFSNRMHKCRCVCGNTVSIHYHKLYYGGAYSCGCTPKPKASLVRPAVDETGKRYGVRSVIRWVEGYGWECVCEECGGLEYYRYARTLYKMRNQQCWKTNTLCTPPRDCLVWDKDTPVDIHIK